MAVLDPEKASKPSLEFEAMYWLKARSRFADFLKSKNVKQKFVDEIMDNVSTTNEVISSIEGSKSIGDNAYGQIASKVISKMHIFISMGDFALKGGPESIGIVWTGVLLPLTLISHEVWC